MTVLSVNLEFNIPVPDRSGLRIELNKKVVKIHLNKGEKYIEPTLEWNKDRSWDQFWS